jgi:Ser/Thr protein kinase RdoA (MazF antagonist)
MDPSDSPAEAEHLLAGNVSTVVRIGDTVRRTTGPWTPAVHALLRYLEEVGFKGAPRVLGIAGQRREVLTYLPGKVPRRASPEVATNRVLAEVGRLLRRYHDAVSGFELPPGVEWYHESDRAPGSVVCHNDLSPRNTVFRDGRPVAFLDWDFASPARPAWDVAHAAWQFVPLTDDPGCKRHGWTSLPDRLRRLRAFCDAYGLAEEERLSFPEFVARRIAATASGIESNASAGVPEFERLVASDVPALVRADQAWVERESAQLRGVLLSKSSA